MKTSTTLLVSAAAALALAPAAAAQLPATSASTVTSNRQPAAPPTGLAAAKLWDRAGGLLEASSTPELGRLYPLSAELFVSPAGDVGVGTTSPGARLHVAGNFLAGTGAAVEAIDSAVVGGLQNGVLGPDTARSFVGGGFNNSVSSTGPAAGGASGIVAGTANKILDAGRSFVGGGNSNRIDATGAAGILDAFIGAGRANRVSGYACGILGGQGNQASGDYGAVLGGELNEAAGAYSAVSGYRARALHDGTFVRADGQFSDFASTAPDQFLIRAQGGVGIGTNAPGAQLDVAGSVRSSGPTGGSYIAFNPLNQGSSVSFNWLNDQARIRVGGSGPGTNNGFEVQGVGNKVLLRITDGGDVIAKDQMYATAFVQTSDARLKTDVRELDGALAAVRELRGVRFQWDREQCPGAEQGERIGFLAQEVRAVVPEAVREREDGTLAVSYAELVPVLVEALKQQDRRIAELEARLAE
jgi:hypothetical protein